MNFDFNADPDTTLHSNADRLPKICGSGSGSASLLEESVVVREKKAEH
jgi:hypothetical protein